MISMIFASGPDVIRLSRFNQTNYPLDYSSRFLLFPIFQNLFLITSYDIAIEAGERQGQLCSYQLWCCRDDSGELGQRWRHLGV